MNHSLGLDDLNELRSIAKSLEDSDSDKILKELLSAYKTGRIEGLESAFSKMNFKADNQ